MMRWPSTVLNPNSRMPHGSAEWLHELDSVRARAPVVLVNIVHGEVGEIGVVPEFSRGSIVRLSSITFVLTLQVFTRQARCVARAGVLGASRVFAPFQVLRRHVAREDCRLGWLQRSM